MHPAAAALIGLSSSATDLPDSSLSFSTCELRSTFERDLVDASPTARSSAAPAERDPGTHPFEVWVTDDAVVTPATHTRTFAASDCLKGATLAATLE